MVTKESAFELETMGGIRSRDILNNLFLDHLLRLPSDMEVVKFFNTLQSPEVQLQEILKSEEYNETTRSLRNVVSRTNGPRLLLLGAFGNGNLGDDIQAAAMRELVVEALPRHELFAASFFSDEYEFYKDRKLPGAITYSKSMMSLFDAIIVGGGGLLAHPHHPLCDPWWGDDVGADVYMLGVGANQPTTRNSGKAITNARLIGARDQSSLDALASLTDRTSLFFDPVLLSERILMKHIPAENSTREKDFHICWVVRPTNRMSAKQIFKEVGADDIVIGIEPLVDEVLLAEYPNIILTKDLDIVESIFDRSKVVVSMRYHGLILALKKRIPAYSFASFKSKCLLTHLGCKNRAISRICRDDLINVGTDISAWARDKRSESIDFIRCMMTGESSVIVSQISKADVVSVYNALLGREPESAAVINEQRAVHKTVKSLVDSVLVSDEYKARSRGNSFWLKDVGEINLECSELEEAELFKHVSDTWTQYGVSDPFYSVLTSDRYRGTHLSGDMHTEFFEEGRRDAELILSVLKSFNLKGDQQSEILDFGCGVGRLAVHLAPNFKKYHGVDISPPHLLSAKAETNARGIKNARFLNIEDFLKKKKPFVDIAFSLIVLQHNPPPIIPLLIQRMCASLRPGGALIFQLPTRIDGYSFNISDYLIHKGASHVMEMHAVPQKDVFRILLASGMELVHVQEWDMIGPIGLSSVFVARKL